MILISTKPESSGCPTVKKSWR